MQHSRYAVNVRRILDILNVNKRNGLSIVFERSMANV